jgi:hypothetical protein
MSELETLNSLKHITSSMKKRGIGCNGNKSFIVTSNKDIL